MTLDTDDLDDRQSRLLDVLCEEFESAPLLDAANGPGLYHRLRAHLAAAGASGPWWGLAVSGAVAAGVLAEVEGDAAVSDTLIMIPFPWRAAALSRAHTFSAASLRSRRARPPAPREASRATCCASLCGAGVDGFPWGADFHS